MLKSILIFIALVIGGSTFSAARSPQSEIPNPVRTEVWSEMLSGVLEDVRGATPQLPVAIEKASDKAGEMALKPGLDKRQQSAAFLVSTLLGWYATELQKASLTDADKVAWRTRRVEVAKLIAGLRVLIGDAVVRKSWDNLVGAARVLGLPEASFID